MLTRNSDSIGIKTGRIISTRYNGTRGISTSVPSTPSSTCVLVFPWFPWINRPREKIFPFHLKLLIFTVVYQRLKYLVFGFGHWSITLNNLHLISYLPRITNRTDLFITICTVCQAGTNISFCSRYISYFRHGIGVGRVTSTSSFEVTISCPTFPKGPELAGILGSTLLLEFWKIKYFEKFDYFQNLSEKPKFNQNQTLNPKIDLTHIRI